MNQNELSALNNRIDQEKAILVYFYNDDCPPCIALRPKVEQLMVHFFPRMKLEFINSKSNPAIPVAFNVFSNPSLLIFFEGKEFKRFSKYISIKELEEAILKYYTLLFEDS
jgi:thiol-disulfide isomerase/thioredoxin